jgi:hypothetical protein
MPQPSYTFEALKARFDAAGQGHVFQFYNELSAEEQVYYFTSFGVR